MFHLGQKKCSNLIFSRVLLYLYDYVQALDVREDIAQLKEDISNIKQEMAKLVQALTSKIEAASFHYQ